MIKDKLGRKKNPKFSENEWQKEHEVDSALGDYDFLRYRCEEEFDPELITDLEEERCKQNLRQYEAEATLDWHEAKDRLENEYFEAGQYLLQAEEPEDEDQAAKHQLDLQEEEWWEIQRQEHLAEEEWREIQRQEHLAEEEWRKIPLHYSDSKFIIYEDE